MDDVFTLYYLTDLHIGNALCDEKLLKEDVACIADDPKAIWIGGGDYADFINRADRRHRESSLAAWLYGKDDIAQEQIKYLENLLSPILDKCLGLCRGNHEDDILSKSERDVYSAIVNMVARPNRPVRLGYGGWVVLLWEDGKKTRWHTTIFCHHGSGGGILPGGDALTLGRLPTWYDFDIAILGHRHTKHWLPNTITGPTFTASKLQQREQAMLFGGTYLGGIDLEGTDLESYAEARLLPPRSVGGIKIQFMPAQKTFKIVI
ncbi:MAG: hypothetical protein A2W25_11940 [candidate division Zixibacteria bacterium RBG_16_53_22]|nr:MAG: hypothetical protein A2W25_11940 [candidate division Zixibacteria bacterium RBG_16_53_22]